MFPDEFVPTKIALGSIFFPVTGSSSGRSRLSAGMLNSTQWTQVPMGASGSSMMSANDCVAAGGSVHASAGDTFLPTQEYLAGMDCPLVNASLVSAKDMVASVEDVTDESGSEGVEAVIESSAVAAGDGESAGNSAAHAANSMSM